MKLLKRHYIAWSVAGMLGTLDVAFAQQVDDPAILFDDIAPAQEDNLPPGAVKEAAFVNSEANADKRKPHHIPTIQEKMRPFNSKRIELIELLQKAPRKVSVAGKTYPLNNPQRVQTFYLNEQYPTVWSQENTLNTSVSALQRLIADAPQDALPVGRYHFDVIQGLQPNQSYQDIIGYELLLTDAYLTLAGDLANGLVNPRKTQPEWNGEMVSDDALGDMLARGIMLGDIGQEIRNINRDNIRYQVLKKRYNALRSHSNVKTPALPAVVLHPGANNKAVPILRQKLGVSGSGNYYDQNLVNAVKTYQRNLGLRPDGIIGQTTRDTLNASHREITDKLMINMERQRWMPRDLGNPYVLVNIPDFVVKMYQNNKAVYTSKAVVGRKDRQTPAFTDKLRHIVMSPTWTVPATILRKDKLARLRANPGAFDGRFEVVTPGGGVVSPSAINWHAVNPGNYALRQKPGKNNALGQVKFLFPNKYAIYLHDTPSKSLFNKTVRAFSSGCVRLQKPTEFAQVLLKNTEWNLPKIKRAMNQKREQWVNTPNTVPIYLVYWTVWATPEGKIRFAKDIYGKDAALLKQYLHAMQ